MIRITIFAHQTHCNGTTSLHAYTSLSSPNGTVAGLLRGACRDGESWTRFITAWFEALPPHESARGDVACVEQCFFFERGKVLPHPHRERIEHIVETCVPSVALVNYWAHAPMMEAAKMWAEIEGR
jgi:hypothetical protein